MVIVLAVVHVNGGRRCTFLKCRSLTGKPTGCSSRGVRGNINSIRVVRNYGSKKCKRGRNYILHNRNKKVLGIRGKCAALFKVCFTLASDPYKCYYYTYSQRKLIRARKTTYAAVCKRNCGLYRRRRRPSLRGCGTCSCCKWRD